MISRILNYFRKETTIYPIAGREKSKNELLKLAYTDLMTGCYNRNALEENREIFDRMGLFVAVVDIDGLKITNDNLGHDAGDQLIKSIADQLIKFGDVVFRLGGDEFLIFSTDLWRLTYRLGKMCNISFGITCKVSSRSLKAAMTEADRIMYIDKKMKKGR